MKVAFNGASKLIIVDNGITELDAQVDLYSDWKEWLRAGDNGDNTKFVPAMRTVGGDPTTGVKSVAPYFFLTNGWKIRPYEGDHTLTISGNLFVDEPETYGYSLTIPTLGDYTVTVMLSTTSDAITVTAGSGLSTEEHNQLDTTYQNVGLLKKIESNKWNIANDQLVIYDNDGTTPLVTFNLTGDQTKAYSGREPV